MKHIGLISDTHSHLEPAVFDYFADCDEIWHAGDIGHTDLADALEEFKPFRAVYGNIDGAALHRRYPLVQDFEIEGLRVYMVHIGGYPGRYSKGVKAALQASQADLFITGHSHIVKAMPDRQLNLLHLNPGAAGRHGWHKEKTLMRFKIEAGQLSELELIELGPRGQIAPEELP